jgi:hypothetical protein
VRKSQAKIARRWRSVTASVISETSWFGPWALAAAFFCVATGAQAAAPGVWFEVRRAPDAQACPDARKLTFTVNELFDASVVRGITDANDAALKVSVTISKVAEAYSATFRIANERWMERRIVDQDHDCRGLPEALAVAVVLLIEPDATPKRKQGPGIATRPDRPSSRSPRLVQLAAEGGALTGTGLLGSWGLPAFGAFLGASVSYAGPGVRVRGVRLFPRSTPAGNGSIELDAWAVWFGPCWSFDLPSRWTLQPCAELGLGRQRGAANELAVRTEASAPWRGVTVDITLLAPLTTLVSASLAVGGAFRLHRENYWINDRLAESQAAFAPFLGIGLALGKEIGGGG